MEMTLEYKLIASEPIEEMVNAGVNAWVNQENPNKPINFVEIFKAMWRKAPVVEQKPFAYAVGDYDLFKTVEQANKNIRNPYLKPEPLYTHPHPKRDPLSSDDIYDIAKKYIKHNGNSDIGGISEYDIESLVRDIEKEYGIGTQ